MKKMICCLLALSMLSAAFLTGCGSDETVGETQDTGAAAETVPAETEPAFEADDLPADLNYNGTTVTTFGWSGPALPEFYVDEQNGDLVHDAIFKL
ncbi:MAG: hypothetical protein IKY52_09710, partial [Clostridia bacterium]|nr:hypothetical protein [Clostridia bacterium]